LKRRLAGHFIALRAVICRIKKPVSEFKNETAEANRQNWTNQEYPWYLASPGKRPRWLRTGRLLGEHGIPRDSQEGRREFGRQMEQRRQSESGPEQYKPLRRGWCFGDKGFRKELLGQMAERVGESHYGVERRESGGEKAGRIVGEELKRSRWAESSLAGRRKSDPEKVKIVLRLRMESIMTLKWIAQRLQMGSWTNVSNCLANNSK
jgi:hypothetical protein